MMDNFTAFMLASMRAESIKATLRATRRPGAQAQIDLSQVREWWANTVEYGFTGQEDLFRDRITVVGVETVNTMVQDTIDEYQRMLAALLDVFVERTTSYKKRIILPTGGTLQPLDEWGNPLPRKPSGKYEVAFPIQGGGDAWGDNRVSRAKMTVGDANRYTGMVLTADADWLRRHILAALFTNVTWTFIDPDDDIGSLTIQPLANGDTVVYLRKGGSVSTDQHFLAQAAAIADATNPYPIIEAELSEHPSNSGDVISMIPTNLVASTRALATFRPAADPNLNKGANLTTFVGSPVVAFGDKFLGYEDSGVFLVEWKSLPDNYIVSYSTGASPSIVAMREHAEAELQGLFPEFADVDGNRQLHKFIRYAGFAVQNRVGACVYRIGNAAYAIPTGFTAPLSV